MSEVSENLYPVFHRMLGRAEKESHLRQQARVIWLYGLSGSGKTTLAVQLERRLFQEGFTTALLDGDNVRTGLNAGLGFSDEDRTENIRRIAEVSNLLLQAGIICINCFITPRESMRAQARQILGEENLIEVYVECSFEKCAERDVKGLYAKASSGQVPSFSGKDSAFEPPAQPGLTLNTEQLTEHQALEALYNHVKSAVVFREMQVAEFP